jgi:hypothetical protein
MVRAVQARAGERRASIQKSTVPVGVPVSGGIPLTVAIKVTVWPEAAIKVGKVGGGPEAGRRLPEEMSCVTVDGFTIWFKPLDVLALKVGSPLYVAEIVW